MIINIINTLSVLPNQQQLPEQTVEQTLTSSHVFISDYTMTTMGDQSDPMSEINAGNMHMKLMDCYVKISEEEERFKLLRSLQSKGLVTRDIMSFVKKQSQLRTFNKKPDRKTARRAMSAKITDSLRVLNHKRDLGRRTKAICLNILGNKKFKLRKLMRSIRQGGEVKK